MPGAMQIPEEHSCKEKGVKKEKESVVRSARLDACWMTTKMDVYFSRKSFKEKRTGVCRHFGSVVLLGLYSRSCFLHRVVTRFDEVSLVFPASWTAILFLFFLIWWWLGAWWFGGISAPCWFVFCVSILGMVCCSVCWCAVMFPF